MKFTVLSIPLVGLLIFGMSFSFPTKPILNPKPKVILLDAYFEGDVLHAAFPMSENFMESGTESLEDICVTRTHIIGSHKKSSHITMSEKDSANVILQLELTLDYDYGRVKKKKKWGYKIIAGDLTLGYKYSGEIDIKPEAYLIIRDPATHGLLERKELELSKSTVSIESAEVATYSEIEGTLKDEVIQGVTDVVNDAVEEIGEELDNEIVSLLNDQNFNNSLLNY